MKFFLLQLETERSSTSGVNRGGNGGSLQARATTTGALSGNSARTAGVIGVRALVTSRWTASGRRKGCVSASSADRRQVI